MALKPLRMLCLAAAAMALLAMFSTCQESTFDDLIMAEKHQKWMSEFYQTYKDEDEKAMRFQVFQENLAYIEAFNQQAAGANKTYKLALNKYSDLTNHEFLAGHTGYKSGLGSNSLSSSTFKYAEVNEVPESIDWREKGGVTGVKNQGQCGCCWAFSAIAALEGLYQIKTGNLTSFSEQELIDCDTKNNGCKGGTMKPAFDYITKNNGITTEGDYRYKAFQSDTCNSAGLRRVNVSTDHFEIVPSNDESSLMKAVANQPVSVGIRAGGYDFQHYATGVFNGVCGKNLNHAVALVGYGVDSNGMKFWLVKNSWGTDWGEKGYMKLQKDAVAAEGLCGLAIDASYPTAAAA